MDWKGHKESLEFEALVTNYLNDVRKLIYSYVKNYQTMEDLTQEVYLTVFQHIDSFRGESSIKTWLFKIAINKCKDYLKSWQYRRIVLTDYFQEGSREKSTESTIMDNMRNEELAKLVMELPLKYREIITLYYYHNLNIHEISDLLNINVHTVKTRLARGRDQIKRRLDF